MTKLRLVLFPFEKTVSRSLQEHSVAHRHRNTKKNTQTWPCNLEGSASASSRSEQSQVSKLDGGRFYRGGISSRKAKAKGTGGATLETLRNSFDNSDSGTVQRFGFYGLQGRPCVPCPGRWSISPSVCMSVCLTCTPEQHAREIMNGPEPSMNGARAHVCVHTCV